MNEVNYFFDKERKKKIIIFVIYLCIFIISPIMAFVMVMCGVDKEHGMVVALYGDFISILFMFLLIVYMFKESILKELRNAINEIKKTRDNIFVLIVNILVFGTMSICSMLWLKECGVISINQSAIMEYRNINRSLAFVIAVILAPIVEEAVFRGILFNKLRKHFFILAHIISAFAFGLIHCIWQIAGGGIDQMLIIIPYFIIGIGISVTYERTHNITYACMFHIIWNLL